jgi:hypothetical protein
MKLCFGDPDKLKRVGHFRTCSGTALALLMVSNYARNQG